MYASGLNRRDKSGALAAVIAIHAGLALVLLNLSGTISLVEEQDDLSVFDVEPVEPPPVPPVPEEERPEPDQAEEPEGAASPENIRSQATPVVAPEPEIEIPRTPPITSSPTPNQGAAPTQGAAPVPGPGTGAGGSGTGTGAGGSGTGTGGGGGGIAIGPQVVRSLTGRDYPDAVWQRWPRGGEVFVAIRVHPNGRATDCRVDRSSGDPVIDSWTCRLVETVARFRPAVNARGEPVTAWYGYIQRDTGRLQRR